MSRQNPRSIPFPRRQLTVIALCRVCEPIAFMSIFPYVYQMVSDFDTGGDKNAIAMYAGMLTSSFALAEFASGIFWGRLSDRIGRKPVLLGGLAGTGFSMALMGFSTDLKTAIIARALGGLLNGNIGVINTTVGELVTEKTHQARAFSIMPGVWCIGGIIGAMVGGLLADPVHGWPTVFSDSTLFAEYPYLLPNLVCTAVTIVSLTIGLLFLEETHRDIRGKRDYGLMLGRSILGGSRHRDRDRHDYNQILTSEKLSLAEETASETSTEALPSPIFDGRDSIDNMCPSVSDLASTSRSSPRRILSKQMVVIIASMGVLAYHTIVMEQLLPVILSLTENNGAVRLPFHFTSGFGLDTESIGILLSGQGVFQALATFLVFPLLSKRLGSLHLYRLTGLTYPLLYILVPYTSILPHPFRRPSLILILIWKVCAQSFSFPPLSIALTNSCPSERYLGALNGASAAAASLSRASGPVLSGLLQRVGLSAGVLGLPWWVNGVVAIVGFGLSLLISATAGQFEVITSNG